MLLLKTLTYPPLQIFLLHQGEAEARRVLPSALVPSSGSSAACSGRDSVCHGSSVEYTGRSPKDLKIAEDVSFWIDESSNKAEVSCEIES